MRRDPAPQRPFGQAVYELARGNAAPLTLEPIGPDDVNALAHALAAIDPWAAYGSRPAGLVAFLAAEEADCCRRAIRCGGELAGAVVVRSPWLHGPYLQLLGLLPGHQGQGLGAAVLDWMATESGPSTRNLWLCVTATNTRARAFYARHGFEYAASLDALVTDGMDEILMRKRLTTGSRVQG